MNFQNLIRDLIDSGMTQQQIAAHCGVHQSAISDLLNGVSKNPLYATGQKLVELHIALTEKRQ